MTSSTKRLILRGLGWLIALTLAAALAVLGLFLWALHSYLDAPDPQPSGPAKFDTAAMELRTAAADGELTEREVTNAVGRFWHVEVAPDYVMVTAYFSSERDDRCFSYPVLRPLGSSIGTARNVLSIYAEQCVAAQKQSIPRDSDTTVAADPK